MKNVEILIIGQGLAGSLLAWELHRKGISFAVIDENRPVTSSKIAAGMFNPVNTKRFTVTADAEKAIGDALEIYHSMETAMNIDIIHRQDIYNVFGNVKESNDYTLKADHPFFQKYTTTATTAEDHVIQPLGAFEVGLSGWIDMKKMLPAIRDFITTHYFLSEEVFDHSLLNQTSEGWSYKNILSHKIMFCEGYKGSTNPFFSEIKIVPCKGDVLEFEAPGFNPSHVIKKGIYIVPLGNGRFKAGSTYKWENADENLHESDQEELTQKIAELIDIPFRVTAHYTAIRPTTKTRDTLFKIHPEHPGMYFINGLGTKGVINGASAIRQLIDTLD